MAAIGLDRKARLYHVPTGNLLSTIYIKQKGTCVLLDCNAPFTDNTQSYTDVVNTKLLSRTQALGERVWNEMDPVADEFEDDGTGTPAPATPPGSALPTRPAPTPSPAPLAPARAGEMLPPSAVPRRAAAATLAGGAAKRSSSAHSAERPAAPKQPLAR